MVPFEISMFCHIRLSLVTFFEEIAGIMFLLQGWKPTKSAFRHVHPDPSWTGHNGTGIGMKLHRHMIFENLDCFENNSKLILYLSLSRICDPVNGQIFLWRHFTFIQPLKHSKLCVVGLQSVLCVVGCVL